MNVFDQSDSDEDEVPPKKPLLTLMSNEDNEDNNGNEGSNDEAEDPLDAYMKSLNDDQHKNQHNQPRAARLDVENEEEATSHWKEREAESKQSSAADQSKDASESALNTMFHKAGSVAPDQIKLEEVQHSNVKYEPFRKNFLPPKDTSWGHQWRNENTVTCTPGTIDPVAGFEQIQDVLGTDLISTVKKKGYVDPTAVQAQTLAVALAGRDALVTASTGSGKTLAYIWPMVVHVCDQRMLDPGEGPIGIVLVPTRELALQVQKYAQTMIQPLKGKSMAITGGVNNYQLVQNFSKSGCEIVVATPGRFLDVLSVKKNGISLLRVTMIVLDECDKMLDMGFEAQVVQILKNVRPDRQSLLLSATIGRKVEKVVQQWLTNPVRVSVGRTGQASNHVQQHVMVLPSFDAKKQWIKQMVPVLADVGRTLVFVATRVDCETLADIVRGADQSLVIETLHGDKHASDRQTALRAFAKGKLSALIATDVASRGLDIANVSTIVNFDPAKNLDIHTHRVGRAGRLSKDDQKHTEGTAYTLLTGKNADFAHVLMGSFERDGRGVISDELRALAGKSRRSGNVASRDKWNKAGLGFANTDPSNEALPPGDTNYYGRLPPGDAQPPKAKKSRWG